MSYDIIKAGSADEVLVQPHGRPMPGMSVDQLTNLAEYFRVHKAGVPRYAPKTCDGPSCSYYAECPLHINGVELPVGQFCSVELTHIHNWMTAKCVELNVQPEDTCDQDAIGAHAINKLLITRLLTSLGQEDMIVDSFRALTQEGEAVYERKVHPALNAIRDLQKLNQNIEADLMATRREKSKDNARKRLSPTEASALLKKKMALAREKLNKSEDVLSAHYRNESINNDDIQDAEIVIKKTPPAEPKLKPVAERLDIQPPKPTSEPTKPKRDPRTGFLIGG